MPIPFPRQYEPHVALCVHCLPFNEDGGVYCAVRTEYSNTSQVCLSLVGCAVGLRLLTAEAGVRSQVSPHWVCGGQICTGTGFLWVLRSLAVTVLPAMLHTHPHLIIAFIRKISWRILRFFQQTDAISDIRSSPDQVLSLFVFQALPTRSNIGGRRFYTAWTELVALLSVQSNVMWFWDWALSGAHNGTCIAGSVVDQQVVLVSASGDRTDGRTVDVDESDSWDWLAVRWAVDGKTGAALRTEYEALACTLQ